MILVIDDNPGFSRIIRKMLEAAGYKVEVATTAEEGLGLLCDADRKGEPFELALIDYRLGPGSIDGLEIGHIARERGSTTKFVLISGEFQGEEEAKTAGLSLRNFEQVIGKPILATAMVELVNRYTGRKMSLPVSRKIIDAAAAAGIEVGSAATADKGNGSAG